MGQIVYPIFRYDEHDEGDNLECIRSSKKEAEDYIAKQLGHHSVSYKDFTIKEWEVDVTVDHCRGKNNTCPQCSGPADNGYDRSFPPITYWCTKCAHSLPTTPSLPGEDK